MISTVEDEVLTQFLPKSQIYLQPNRDKTIGNDKQIDTENSICELAKNKNWLRVKTAINKIHAQGAK